MEQKVTLSELVTLLSVTTGIDRATCEDFLREFTALVTDTLTAGESVKVKGLGVFKVADVQARKSVNVNTGEEIVIPGHSKVKFVADKRLAEAINAPFSAFVAEDLADGVTEEELEAVGETDVNIADNAEAEMNNDVTSEIKAVETPGNMSSSKSEESNDVEGVENEGVESEDVESIGEEVLDSAEDKADDMADDRADKLVADETHNADPFYEALEEQLAEPAVEVTVDETPPTIQQPMQRKSKFMSGYVLGLVTALLLIVAIGVGWRLLSPDSFDKILSTRDYSSTRVDVKQEKQGKPKVVTSKNSVKSEVTIEKPETEAKVKSVESEKTQREKSIEDAVATQPSDVKPVYDVISKTRFLTTMAKEHYGNYNLWPYIYEENKAILGHPDRIKPGTRVVIPPASKYGIDASNKECVERAKKKGVEIYARYR